MVINYFSAPKVNNPITNARPVFDWGAVREEMKISAVTKWAGEL